MNIVRNHSANPSAIAGLFEDVYGPGYFSEEDIRTYVQNNRDHLLSARRQGELGGVIIVRRRTVDELRNDLRCPLQPLGLRNAMTGLFKSVAVRTDWQRSGIATALMEAVLSDLNDRNIEQHLSVAWVEGGESANAAPLLQRFRFEARLGVRHYWFEDSLEGHECVYCGRPCRCPALIFIRNDAD